jgi:hypothetical protein
LNNIEKLLSITIILMEHSDEEEQGIDIDQEPVVQKNLDSKKDKRKTTSSANLAKARLKKLENLKKAKQEKERSYEVYHDSSTEEYSSESESDEEELVIKKKKNKSKSATKMAPPKKRESESTSEVQELKAMMAMLIKQQTKDKKKKKKPAKQISIQLPASYAQPPQQAPAKPSDPRMDQLTSQLISWL